VLRAREDRSRLRARPFEGLLDLGARRIRELGRLVTGLLEEPVPARLGFLQLARRVAVRVREQLARLVAGGVHHLGALALRFLAVALDLGLALLQLALPAPHLLLGALELRRRSRLRVALDRVRELGGRTDQVQRVHPDRVARRLDVLRTAAARGLQHLQLRLELRRVSAEGIEGLLDALGIEAVADLRNILVPR
jgi:hypothetical protein